MNSSKLVNRLQNGEIVFTAKINTSCPRVAAIATQSGFSCLWLDMEHVPSTISQIEKQVYAAKSEGAEVIVRVPRGSYSDLIQPLELGATGIMVPHVLTADEAAALVRQVKFHPIGCRALDGGNADNCFGSLGTLEYIQQANQNTLLILQIEDPQAIQHVDKIAAIPGVDMLFFGPGDFAHALGIPGEYNDPRILEARDQLVQSTRRHGKLAGTVSLGNDISHLINQGFQLINIAADVAELRQGFKKSYLRVQSEVSPNSETKKPANMSYV